MHWISIVAVTAITLSQPALCLQPQDRLSNTANIAVTTSTTTATDAPSYRQDLLNLHKNLVDIHSISGDEGKVGQFLVDYLNGKGFTTDVQFVPAREGTPEGNKRFNVLAWHSKTNKPKPKVLLTSHIDVVPPHIDYSISPGDITKDTMISGRGTVDAKGSVASMIIALEQLLASGKALDDQVLLLFVVDEETGGTGMRSFSSATELNDIRTFKAAIFGEPTESKLVCGHKGGLTGKIIAKGKASHSGYPWLGKSANERIIHVWSKILAADLGHSERYGNTTINLGVMNGGVAANVVPAHAETVFMIRVATAPQATGHEAVKAQIKAIVEEVDKESLSVTFSPGYGAVDCECNVEGKSRLD